MAQTVKLESIKQSLAIIKQELDKRKNNLRVSVEEIYKLAGAKDIYVMISFFPGSPAYDKYGETVHGVIWYHKQERERLEKVMQEPQPPRTNGDVYLSSGITDEALKYKLQHEGFRAEDIVEIYTAGKLGDQADYKHPGTKTIPNTHTIKINPKTFDVVAAQQYVLGNYLKQGYELPLHDIALYYTNLYLFKKEKISEQEIEQYLLKPDKSGFTDLANFMMLQTKVRENIAGEKGVEEFKQLLKKRSAERMQFITQHLGISPKKITELITADFPKYMAIQVSTWMFETETLVYLSPKASIYWDFERFMHILLRHNPDFFIAASSKGQGTSFQYKQKDLSRLAKILIEQLKDGIIKKLEAGKDFSAQGVYFNGNHYQVRIAADGRLMQFGPMD